MFSVTYNPTNQLANQLSGKRQPHDLLLRVTHLPFRRYSIAHRGPNVGMPHKPLLHTELRPDFIEPGTKRMAERVRTEVLDAGLHRRFSKRLPYSGVGERQTADL